MGKISELERKQAELEAKFNSKSDKPFKLPGKATSAIKKGNKLPDSVVTLYLTQKSEMKWKLQKVVSGNIIVVNNKAHELDPECLWRMGKHHIYIHREIDRKPVSNKDYALLKKEGRDTDSDVVLIKAVLGAMMKPKQELKKGWIIWIVIAAVVALMAFIFLKKPEEAAVVAPALIGLFPKRRLK